MSMFIMSNTVFSDSDSRLMFFYHRAAKTSTGSRNNVINFIRQVRSHRVVNATVLGRDRRLFVRIEHQLPTNEKYPAIRCRLVHELNRCQCSNTNYELPRKPGLLVPQRDRGPHSSVARRPHSIVAITLVQLT